MPFADSLTSAHMCSHPAQGSSSCMQARIDKERYQQALTEYQQRMTMSEAGLEESQDEPYATYQPQGGSRMSGTCADPTREACGDGTLCSKISMQLQASQGLQCLRSCCAHCCAGNRCPAACRHEGDGGKRPSISSGSLDEECGADTMRNWPHCSSLWGAGQESASTEPEGPPTLGRSRYKGSPSLRGLPPLQISPPEPGRGLAALHTASLSGRHRVLHPSVLDPNAQGACHAVRCMAMLSG